VPRSYFGSVMTVRLLRVTRRLSKPDLRSIVDRLSPISPFSSAVRGSTPLRRSLSKRRPAFERLSSIAIAISPKSQSSICSGFNEHTVKGCGSVDCWRSDYTMSRNVHRLFLKEWRFRRKLFYCGNALGVWVSSGKQSEHGPLAPIPFFRSC
jgi:hypothetical protein